MIRVAVLDDYVGCAETFGDWAALGDAVETTFYRDAIAPERLVEELGSFDVLLITQDRTHLSREVLGALPNLKLIVTNGSTSALNSCEGWRELGITMCGTADTVAPPAPSGGADQPARNLSRVNPLPSEVAWAQIFSLAKRIVIENRNIRDGGWQAGFPVQLHGKTLGFAGLGNIGGMMVPQAKAFGMEVIAWSENLTQARTDELGVRRVSKAELLAESDFLVVATVLGDRTRGLFQADDFAQMKSSAYLINISRGPIVDERALVDALRTGEIAGAGLDVFDLEPLPGDHPLRSLDNVVLTPHFGYVSEARFRSDFARMAEDVAAFVEGHPIRLIP